MCTLDISQGEKLMRSVADQSARRLRVAPGRSTSAASLPLVSFLKHTGHLVCHVIFPVCPSALSTKQWTGEVEGDAVL